MTDWCKFDEPTPRTFIGEIGVVDFVIDEAVVEETAQERAWRKWGMKEEWQPAPEDLELMNATDE